MTDAEYIATLEAKQALLSSKLAAAMQSLQLADNRIAQLESGIRQLWALFKQGEA